MCVSREGQAGRVGLADACAVPSHSARPHLVKFNMPTLTQNGLDLLVRVKEDVLALVEGS